MEPKQENWLSYLLFYQHFNQLEGKSGADFRLFANAEIFAV